MNIPKSLKPAWTTVCFPDEYNIEGELREAVQYANSCDGKSGVYITVDIGKLVGLYLAYKRLLEKTNENNSG